MLDVIGAILLTAIFGLMLAIITAALHADILRVRIAGSGAGARHSVALHGPAFIDNLKRGTYHADCGAGGHPRGPMLGVFFLLLHDAGRLPARFANTAGWGDVVIGLAALPLAWAIHHQIAGWRRMTFAWNVLGVADLVTRSRSGSVRRRARQSGSSSKPRTPTRSHPYHG